jgi:hypothetical protein
VGLLVGAENTITAITFTAQAHKRAGRFTVPKRLAEELGSGDDLPIWLTVESEGKVVFDGRIKLASGTEAYPIPGVESHARITVTGRRL